jgi:adenosylcobinamide-phosphate synthase
MSVAPWELLAAISLDLVLGDPHWLPHPVRGLGWLISRAESLWRWTRLPLRIAGALMWVSVIAAAAMFVWTTTPWLNVYWIWSFLALRSLDIEAASVMGSLEVRNLDEARAKLAMIVGRDAAALEEPEIVRAVIETVSENTTDGVIAPLFYLMIGGPAGMAAYKAVNTMDSMIGYRNARYREFGWFAARADDLFNLIPARLTAGLVWMCALLFRLDARRSIRITLRDAALQPSPNSGYPEAAYAGALGIQLGGVSTYGGVPSRKAYLGDPVEPLTAAAFRRARQLLYGSSLAMAAIAFVVIL